MTRRSIFAAAALAALLAPVLPALAKTGAPSGQTVSVTVPLAGLNLDSAAGADMALRRISAATRVTCGDLAADLTPAERAEARRCRQDAVAAAVATLNQPMVAAQAKTGDWAKLADR